MTAVLSRPSDVSAPVREAGGDNEVPRDKLGRPRIRLACVGNCEGTGKVPSEKTGKPVNCPKCKGKGEVVKSYTRTTTYIDVLDDKSNLQAWGERMTLVGVNRDQRLLEDVESLHEEATAVPIDCGHSKKDRIEKGIEPGDCRSCDARRAKDELNRRAQVAKVKAGAEEKADKGTELHGLSELVDQGLELPKGIDFGDVIDMDAYRRATEGFRIEHMEKLVVHDEIFVGGTPDRVSEWCGDVPLIAPDGKVYEPNSGRLLITDLKTGSVEYGALKMAMQLSIYSRSLLYDHTTGERSSMGDVDQDWGIIMHVPAGSGTATLYWADLQLGWRAVEVAGVVRELRSAGSRALVAVA